MHFILKEQNVSKCHLLQIKDSTLMVKAFDTLGKYGPAHKISILITYGHILLINTYVDTSSKARGLAFGMNVHLHPYFVHASSKGSGESEHMPRLAGAFAAHQCDRY